jgi:hypothetical protein
MRFLGRAAVAVLFAQLAGRQQIDPSTAQCPKRRSSARTPQRLRAQNRYKYCITDCWSWSRTELLAKAAW